MALQYQMSKRMILFIVCTGVFGFFASLGCWFLAYDGWQIQNRDWSVCGWMAFLCSLGAAAGLIALICIATKVAEGWKHLRFGRLIGKIIFYLWAVILTVLVLFQYRGILGH